MNGLRTRSPGVVAAGDRWRRPAPLAPLKAYPPREVGAWRVIAALFGRRIELPLALGMTVAGVGVWAALATEPGPRPPWYSLLPLLVGAAALVAWILAVRAVARVRRLLAEGMPVRGKVSAVRRNPWVHSGSRLRTTIAYEWSYGGRTFRTRAAVYLGRWDWRPAVGSAIDLICDPSAPGDHLAVQTLGFALEGF